MKTEQSNPAEKREFKGIWIPRSIWLNPDLSLMEKVMLAEIDSLDNEELGGCIASNAYFAKFFNIEEKSVSKIISRLTTKGMVKQVGFDGRRRRLKSCIRFLKETDYAGKRSLTTPESVVYSKGDKKEDIVSKDTKAIPAELKTVIDKWNSIRSVCCKTSIHKQGDSKTIQRIRKYVHSLMNGTFRGMAAVDIKWLKDSGISSSLLSRKWTVRAINKAIEDYALMWQEGYWPPDKSSLPTSLADFLFNTRTGKSFFLKCYSEKPVKNIPNKIKLPKDVYEKYKRLFWNQPDFLKDERNEQWFAKNVKDVMNYAEKKYALFAKYDIYFSLNIVNLFSDFVWEKVKNSDGYKLKPSQLAPGGYMFKEYISNTKMVYNINIDSTVKELQELSEKEREEKKGRKRQDEIDEKIHSQKIIDNM